MSEVFPSNSNYKLLLGIKEDCEELINNFRLTDSFRYVDFVQCWHDMKFSYIYCGHNTLIELIEFTEELFHIVKTYLFPPYSFHTRVGAIYLLYGLYCRQRTCGLVKIRLVEGEMSILSDMWIEMVGLKMYDTCYIVTKLLEDCAIRFTKFSKDHGVDKRRSHTLCLSNQSEKKVSPSDWILNLMKESNITSRWDELETTYMQSKLALKSSVGKELKTFEGGLIPTVLKSIDLLKPSANPRTTAEGVDQDIGTVRRKLKNKKTASQVAMMSAEKQAAPQPTVKANKSSAPKPKYALFAYSKRSRASATEVEESSSSNWDHAVEEPSSRDADQRME